MNNLVPIKKEKMSLNLELKSLDDETGTFEGYGSIFGNKDSYNDIVQPGAFKESLSKTKSQSVKLLWQHDSGEPIGVYEEIYEDEKGLYVRGKLLINDIARAREAYALLKAGAIEGLSIGFTIEPGGASYSKNGDVRNLTKLNLWEISIVTFAANTRAKVASVKQSENTIRDFENFLRDSGKFSKSEAVTIASLADSIAQHPYIRELRRDAEVSDQKNVAESRKQLSEASDLILTALKNGVKKL